MYTKVSVAKQNIFILIKPEQLSLNTKQSFIQSSNNKLSTRKTNTN